MSFVAFFMASSVANQVPGFFSGDFDPNSVGQDWFWSWNPSLTDRPRLARHLPSIPRPKSTMRLPCKTACSVRGISEHSTNILFLGSLNFHLLVDIWLHEDMDTVLDYRACGSKRQITTCRLRCRKNTNVWTHFLRFVAIHLGLSFCIARSSGQIILDRAEKCSLKIMGSFARLLATTRQIFDPGDKTNWWHSKSISEWNLVAGTL